MSPSEADLQWLRNVDTRPGPNAGRSIDPTKPGPDDYSARSVPFDRDTGGWVVREAWIRWAQTQPNPKPSWLVPYAELAEPDKEADRQIAEAVARWIGAVRTQSDAEPSLSDQMYGFHGAGFDSSRGARND